MMKGVSIIICTFNGRDRLSETIKHIANQQVPNHIRWEVILADNASTDGTLEFSKELWNRQELQEVPFRSIVESKPGKLYALQKAVLAATFEYIVICDDDNWLAPDYIKKMFAILDSHPDVGAAGGYGIPTTDNDKFPDWFENYLYAYAVGAQEKQTGYVKPRGVLWGAGLGTKRSIYLKMYKDYQSFLPESDKNILSAEDTEYCMRLILKGYRLYYDSSLIYKHYIPPYKLTTNFRDEKLLKGFKDANEILRKYYAAMRATLKVKGKPHVWLGLLLVSPINILFSFSAKSAEKARDTLYHLLPFRSNSGKISARIKNFMLNDR